MMHFVLTRISYQARLPLQHSYLFCQQTFGDGPDEKHGQEGNHIRRLVCYRGDQFEDEYTKLLKDDGTMWFQTRLAIAASGTNDHSTWLCRMATALITLYYSSTMRRTIHPIRRSLCLVTCFAYVDVDPAVWEGCPSGVRS